MEISLGRRSKLLYISFVFATSGSIGTMSFSLLDYAAVHIHGRRSISLCSIEVSPEMGHLDGHEFFFLAVVQHMPTSAGSGGKGRLFICSTAKNYS